MNTFIKILIIVFSICLIGYLLLSFVSVFKYFDMIDSLIDSI